MYQVDDYVVCGNKGPCVVESFGPLEFNSSGNLYYTLVPLSNLGSKIFIPIEKEENRMRPVLSKEEAMDLLNHIGMIEPIGITEEKRREEIYKENVNGGNCTNLLQMIKTLSLRIQKRKENGKKITAIDEKYFHIAEDRLYSELALSLGTEREKIKKYVAEYFTPAWN